MSREDIRFFAILSTLVLLVFALTVIGVVMSGKQDTLQTVPVIDGVVQVPWVRVSNPSGHEDLECFAYFIKDYTESYSAVVCFEEETR